MRPGLCTAVLNYIRNKSIKFSIIKDLSSLSNMTMIFGVFFV